MSFREKTLTGISWKMAGQVGSESIQLAVAVVLAHLLMPRDFGLVAAVIILTNFASVVSIAGRSALVQKEEVSQELLSSMFWLNVLLGLALTALLAACAPLLARAYGEPELLPLTLCFSAMFFINAFGVTHNALFQRAIDFRSFALMDLLACVLSGAVAVAAAWYGLGVWSLVLQVLVNSLTCVAFYWLASPWRPGFVFDGASVREIMGFSVSALLSDVLAYWTRNVDNLLIGLVLGPGALGIYSRAYAIMLVPVNRIARVLSDVMYPSFSSIQKDRAYVKHVFLKMTRAVALVTFPMMLGVMSVAEHFVSALFGPRWLGMVPVLEVLCLIGMIQSVTMFLRNIYLSQGKAELLLRVELPLQLVQMLGIVAGLRWGILGVAAGYAAASVLVSYPAILYAGRLIGLGVREYVGNLLPVLACAAAMGGALWALPRLVPALSRSAALPAEIVLGVLVYWGLVHAFRVEGYVEVREIALERLRRLPARGGASA
jgi:O-antigen/teichoic acid export membrane protein